MKNVWTGNSRMICYIVAAFMLIMGMCQSRVEADFCFPCDQNGRISSFMDVSDVGGLSSEIAIAEKSRLHESVINAAGVRREGRRTFMRLFWCIASVLFMMQNASVFLRAVTTTFYDKNKAATVILHYLHAKDGKKRFA